MNRVILVCAAHPDDEVLGCGATMARHARDGDDVHVLILGGGIASRGISSEATAEGQAALAQAAQAAAKELGVKSARLLDFPDNRFDSVDRLELARAVEIVLTDLKPSIVYTHDAGDLNVDHVRVHEAVSVACRPMPGSSVRELYFFEVASSSHWRPNAPFTPNHYVDAEDTLAVKLDALRCYASEMRQWPHARSIEALEHLAHVRGSLVGLRAAEAFVTGRTIHTSERS